jgi:hypothetical protein
MQGLVRITRGDEERDKKNAHTLFAINPDTVKRVEPVRAGEKGMLGKVKIEAITRIIFLTDDDPILVACDLPNTLMTINGHCRVQDAGNFAASMLQGRPSLPLYEGEL